MGRRAGAADTAGYTKGASVPETSEHVSLHCWDANEEGRSAGAVGLGMKRRGFCARGYRGVPVVARCDTAIMTVVSTRGRIKLQVCGSIACADAV